MISEKYTKAYKEVLEIYKYLPEHERKRIPIDKWNGTYTTWIPDETIIKNLY